MPSIVPGPGKSVQARGKLTRMGCETHRTHSVGASQRAIEEALFSRESTVVGYP
jgi:hypothetical protein